MVEIVSFHSDALDKEMTMQVYLPEGYDGRIPLPVLYFLHGRSGSERIMEDAGLSAKADMLIAEGHIKPMMIVCPRIENSRGVNSSSVCRMVDDPTGSGRVLNLGLYEDYLIKDVIPFVDGSFCTIKDRSGRYIGGASAGGYAALHSAFRHQQLFSKVGGHMPALELTLEEDARPYFASNDAWEAYDPITIARRGCFLSSFEVFLDAGDEDEGQFFEGCALLHKELKSKGVASSNLLLKGHHNVEYIRGNVEKYLMFYGG